MADGGKGDVKVVVLGSQGAVGSVLLRVYWLGMLFGWNVVSLVVNILRGADDDDQKKEMLV